MTTDDRDDVMNEIERALGIAPSPGFEAAVRARVDADRRRTRPRIWIYGLAVACAVVAIVLASEFAGSRQSTRIQITATASRPVVERSGIASRSEPGDRAGAAEMETHVSRVRPAQVGSRSTRAASVSRTPASPAIAEPLVPPDRARAIARLVASVRADGAVIDGSDVSPDTEVAPLGPFPVLDVVPIKLSALEAAAAASSQGDFQ